MLNKKHCDRARDFFRHVPARQVNLGEYGFGVLRASGLDNVGCDAAGCLAGWLWTMPEFDPYRASVCCLEPSLATFRRLEHLYAWLGLDGETETKVLKRVYPTKWRVITSLFYSGPSGPAGWTEAMRRLDALCEVAAEPERREP